MVCAKPSSSASERSSSPFISLQEFLVKLHVTVDHLTYSKLCADFQAGRSSEPATAIPVGQQSSYGVHQRRGVARRHDYAGILIQLFAYAAYVGGDHGRAAAHSLQNHGRQAFAQAWRDDDGG